ncbi:hypothetical protein C7N43_03680 [Sphingobacteriales bacterium UPWRP_1]|nr:hypothetical protein BVG80_08090 [Sphingobacteriales bacterium TSM_CSM]PSJ78442.1 hypothetical protein C7N43_03680 [Sphingobacteriales bacterium UPWRP_1]
MNTPPVSLFFVAQNAFFAEGTLFELHAQLYLPATNGFRPAETAEEKQCADAGYLFPDLGKGEPGLMPAAVLLPCPPFAENLPPVKGALQITRLGIVYDQPLQKPNIDAPIIACRQLLTDETLHWQKIGLPAERLPPITAIEVFDKLRQTDAETYYYPGITEQNGNQWYCCEMSHIRFGFYQLRFFTNEGWYYAIDVIKHFPASVKQKYEVLQLQQGKSESPASLPDALYYSEFGKEAPHRAPPEIENIPPDREELVAFITQFEPGSQPGSSITVAILNQALALSSEWGENFGKPIEARLQRLYPQLDSRLCNVLQQYVKQAEYCIYEQAEQVVLHNLPETEARHIALKKYPWINDHNLSRLLNIGFYYAIR